MKIYISSTFEDLRDYREKVYRQLRQVHHDVISMEDYTAGDQRPLSKCLEDVASVDIYVGIFAWRYGYIPKKNNPAKRSITELEYRKAVQTHKQCLLFLLDENTPWMPRFMDMYSSKKDIGNNIKKFRAELYKSERHMISKFTNADELAGDVISAIYVYIAQFDTSIKAVQKIDSKISAPSRQISALKPGKKVLVRTGFTNLWKTGSILRIFFLDGSPKQQNFVKRFAPIWSAYANIAFEFGDNPDAELRISFEKDIGSWAFVGTDALQVEKSQPTINFGWIKDDTQDTEADYVILREFGHVLGLLNEHQNPLGKIPWNKEAVYKSFQGPPNNWSREDINRNFFSHWDVKRYPIKKPFDPLSIMGFPIPTNFVNGNFKIGSNTGLSIGDKEFISKLYPFENKKKAVK